MANEFKRGARAVKHTPETTMRAVLFAALLLSTPAMAASYPGPIPARISSPFDAPGDSDDWRVFLPSDGRAFGVSVTTECLNKRLELRDAASRPLKVSEPALPEQEAYVEWLPKYAGDYRVVVTEVPAPAGYVCSQPESPIYTVAIAESCLGGRGTICTLTRDVRKRGLVRAIGDVNWYRFTIAERKRLHLSLYGTFEGTPPVITLRDAKGTYITDNLRDPLPGYNGNCVSGQACLGTAVCPGTYYAAVRDDEITRPVGYEMKLDVATFIDRGPCP